MDIHALIVDDSAIMRKMVMRSLKETELAEFTFTEAGDGVEGIEKYNPEIIDIMFVDWNMPNMNGIDMIKAIQEKDATHKPVVMITTESTMGKMDEAMDEVIVDKYIAKPFTVEGLQQRLGPILVKIGEAQESGGFFGKLAESLN